MLQSTTRDLEVVRSEVSPIVSEAQSVVVGSEKDKAVASEILSRLNKWNDLLVEDREKITKPLNEALKEVRAKYKPLEDELGEAIELIRGKIGSYQTLMLEKQRVEEARIASRVKEGKGNLSMETAVRKMSEMDKVASEVVGDSGVVKFRSIKKLLIFNSSLLPHHYMIPNEALIKSDLLLGKEIAGAKIEIEQVPYNSR